MNEIHKDPLLFAKADEALALRRIAQCVERRLDEFVARRRIVVERFVGRGILEQRGSEAVAEQRDLEFEFLAGEGRKVAGDVNEGNARVALGRNRQRRGFLAPQLEKSADVIPHQIGKRVDGISVQARADRIRQRHGFVGGIRANAMNLGEPNQQRDDAIDRIGGLEGGVRGLHGGLLSWLQDGGRQHFGPRPATPLATGGHWEKGRRAGARVDFKTPFTTPPLRERSGPVNQEPASSEVNPRRVNAPMLPPRDRLERVAARAAGALPEFLRSRLVPDRAVADGIALDSRIALLTLLAVRAGQAFRPDASPAAFRRGFAHTNRTLGLRTRGLLATRDLRIPTDDGDIGARFYRPQFAPDAVPLLVYFHGGGFVIGDVDSYDHLGRFFALRGNIAVLSVDYRLGPEHRFPRAHEDAFAAFAFAQTKAAELGADPTRIIVGGDSAGGGLAAAISAFASSRGLASPDAQLLIYPAVDSATDRPSRHYTAPGAPFTPATMAWFAPHYVSSEADRQSPLLSPLLGPVPPGIPTYLLAAAFDPLVDEGFAYAERLRAAGVPVSYDLRPTLSHAFVNIAGVVPAARRALEDAIRVTTMELRNR